MTWVSLYWDYAFGHNSDKLGPLTAQAILTLLCLELYYSKELYGPVMTVPSRMGRIIILVSVTLRWRY